MTAGTELVKRVVNAPLDEWTEERIALAVRTVCPGATVDEAAVFLLRCRQIRLDPIQRQVYFMKDRQGRVSHIVGIDGLRLVATRTGQYEGQVGPLWQHKAGDPWVDYPPEDNNPPHAAKVGVWRRGFKEPLFRVCTYASFVRLKDGKPTTVWANFPAHQLAIRAESHALRAAFPAETAGLAVNYDESGEISSTVIVDPDAKATNDQLAWLNIRAKELGWSTAERHAFATRVLGRGVESWSTLTKGEASELRDVMDDRGGAGDTPSKGQATVEAVGSEVPSQSDAPDSAPDPSDEGLTEESSPDYIPGVDGPPAEESEDGDGEGGATGAEASPGDEAPPEPPDDDPKVNEGQYKGFQFSACAKSEAGREWLRSHESQTGPKARRALALAWLTWAEGQ